MNNRKILLVALYAFVCIGIPAFGGISDSLYRALPAHVRPVDAVHLTLNDSINILRAEWVSKLDYLAEQEQMVTGLQRRYAGTADVHLRMLLNRTVGDFYTSTNRYDLAFPQYLEIRRLYNTTGIQDSVLPESFVYLASIYAIRFMEDSAINLLQIAQEMRRPSGNASDTVFLRNVYNGYEIIYVRLRQYDLALGFSIKELALIDTSQGLSDDYLIAEFGRLDIMTFIGADEDQVTPKLHEAERKLRSLTQRLRPLAADWYASCYFYLGRARLRQHDYAGALPLLDSALRPEYLNTDKVNPQIFALIRVTRAIAQLRLGIAEGYATLKSLPLNHSDYAMSMNTLNVLYEYERRQGHWKEALDYYEQYSAQRDSVAIRRQRGQVFVAEQHYQVAKKESHIARLERNNAVQRGNFQMYLAIVAVLLLSMTLIALAIYIRAQRGRTRTTAQRIHMLDRLKEMQGALQYKDRERTNAIAAERQDISRDVHDELSSSLAAIRYLVSDRRRAAPDDASGQILEEIESEVVNVYAQVRRLMARLNDADRSGSGAENNVAEFVAKLSRQFDAQSSLHISADADPIIIGYLLTPQQHREMTLVVREAVANSMRHSRATQLAIRLWHDAAAGQVRFSIVDNGKGFGGGDLQGMGLRSMKSRLAGMGGMLQVRDSAQGTILEGAFPAMPDMPDIDEES